MTHLIEMQSDNLKRSIFSQELMRIYNRNSKVDQSRLIDGYCNLSSVFDDGYKHLRRRWSATESSGSDSQV